MGTFLSILYWLPAVAALVDYFRRRPDWYWLPVIIFFGPLGPVIYLVVVVLPASGVEEAVSMSFRERRRKGELERLAASEPLPGRLAELGELYFKEGDHAKAITALNHAIEEGIDHDEARYYLGRSYEGAGQPEEAIRHLVKVVRKDPKYKFGEALLALGRVCEASGQTKDAEAAYRQVLGAHTYAEPRLRLAKLLEKDDKIDQAGELMREIVENQRDQPRHVRRRDGHFVAQAKTWLKAQSSD